MWNPAIPDERTWTKFGEHGLSLANMESTENTEKRNKSTK